MLRTPGLLVILAVAACGVLAGCGPVVTAPPGFGATGTPAATPSDPPTAIAAAPCPSPGAARPAICGTLTTFSTGSSIAGRKIVLCLRNDTADLFCTLTSHTTTSDTAGYFQFASVPDGKYLVFYDSGWDAFEAGVATWTDRTIRVGDVAWLSASFYDRDDKGNAIVTIPKTEQSPAQLALLLFYGQSPFYWAFNCPTAGCHSSNDVIPVEYDVTAGSSQSATFSVRYRDY